MARHIKTKPRRPSDVRPDLKLPRQLERLVMRMMEKDRNKRPQSAEELVDTLTRYTHQPSDEDLAIFSEPSSIRRTKSLVPLVAILGVLLVLATGAMLAFALNRQPRLPSERNDPAEAALIIPAAPPEKNLPLKQVVPEVAAVEVTLDSEPTGATVIREGKALGTTPMVVTQPVGSVIAFSFELEGFQTEDAVIEFAQGSPPQIIPLLPERPTKGWVGLGKRGPRPGKDPNSSSPSEPTKTPTKRPGYGRFE
jgi:serine/threonine-protein kinase